MEIEARARTKVGVLTQTVGRLILQVQLFYGAIWNGFFLWACWQCPSFFFFYLGITEIAMGMRGRFGRGGMRGRARLKQGKVPSRSDITIHGRAGSACSYLDITKPMDSVGCKVGQGQS